MASTKLRESLAALAHQQWSGWMRHLFSKSTKNMNGSVTIPPWVVEEWERHAETLYADLPEEAKESDRKQADKMIRLFRGVWCHQFVDGSLEMMEENDA